MRSRVADRIARSRGDGIVKGEPLIANIGRTLKIIISNLENLK
jgi:hypothetical protein